MNWTLSVMLVCLFLAIFTVWLEYKRADRSRLVWRITALLIAIVALACLILPVSYTGNSNSLSNNDAILLTEGYNADSISHDYKNIYTLDKDIKIAYPKAVLLSSIQDMNAIAPAIKQLHILGYGLNESDLNELNVPVSFNQINIPIGINSVNWQQQLKIGEPLQLQGSYNNPSSKPLKMILKGLNTTLDSITIAATKVSGFELSAMPRNTGQAVYTLLIIDGKDTIEKEPVPVSVEAAKPLKILMLSASPDFESKFLKDWLGQNGYVVAFRSTISKDKTSEDFINMDKQPLGNLSSALLGKFDVVIGDLSALKSLSPAENTTLKQQAEQNGLGIIIRADSSGKATSWLDNDFKVNTISSKLITAPLILQGQKNKTLPLNIDPSYIIERPNMQSLVVDGQNHILAGSSLMGEGKLLLITLRNTYTWQLAGNAKDYSALWSLLITKAARKLPPSTSLFIDNGIATVNEPASFSLQNGVSPASISIDNALAAPVQNPTIPYDWNITYWPAKTGWYRANAGNNASWIYVYEKNDWKCIKNLKKIADTKKYSDNRGIIATAKSKIITKGTVEVSKAFFYILLLAACTFLWIERKLSV